MREEEFVDSVIHKYNSYGVLYASNYFSARTPAPCIGQPFDDDGTVSPWGSGSKPAEVWKAQLPLCSSS
jgi:hypothetical protein